MESPMKYFLFLVFVACVNGFAVELIYPMPSDSPMDPVETEEAEGSEPEGRYPNGPGLIIVGSSLGSTAGGGTAAESSLSFISSVAADEEAGDQGGQTLENLSGSNEQSEGAQPSNSDSIGFVNNAASKEEYNGIGNAALGANGMTAGKSSRHVGLGIACGILLVAAVAVGVAVYVVRRNRGSPSMQRF